MPQKVTITFTNEDSVTFTLRRAAVTALTIQLAKTTYVVPSDDCAKLHDVHFETVRLLWEVSSKRAVDAEYSALRFFMGGESDRAFGELPSVDVTFDRGGKYLSTVINRKTSPTTWQGTDR